MVVEFVVGDGYIELTKLLKATDVCASGGMAKIAVTEGKVRVDGVVELRRGRKIRQGQKVEFEGKTIEVK
jgi:ribosome-associated protein